MGDMDSWGGGTLWELSKLVIFIKNLIRNQLFGEYIILQIFNDQE